MYLAALGRRLLSGTDMSGARSAGTRQPDRSHPLVRAMKILAQHVDHHHASGSVVAKEFQKIFSLDERDLGGVQQLGGHFVRCTRHGCTQPEYFSGAGDTQHQALSAF